MLIVVCWNSSCGPTPYIQKVNLMLHKVIYWKVLFYMHELYWYKQVCSSYFSRITFLLTLILLVLLCFNGSMKLLLLQHSDWFPLFDGAWGYYTQYTQSQNLCSDGISYLCRDVFYLERNNGGRRFLKNNRIMCFIRYENPITIAVINKQHTWHIFT